MYKRFGILFHLICDCMQGPPCDESPCLNGGACRPFLRSFVCRCRPQFVGQQCEKREFGQPVGNPSSDVLMRIAKKNNSTCHKISFHFSNERDGREESGSVRRRDVPLFHEQDRPIVSSEKNTGSPTACPNLTPFLNLNKSFSSSTNHDSSELLWDDEFDEDDYDLFGIGTDPSQLSEGDFDEDFGGGGGVYGCVD